jgi:ABC-type methionine transport system permease subunit
MPSVTSYYFPSDPPYFLFVISLVAGLACGVAFESTLKELVQEWKVRRTSRTLLQLKGSSIQIPYIGITLCIGIFLSSGLEIFGFPSGLAYSVAAPLTVGSAYFVWRQLGKLLVELDRGGSAAMDLDIFE